MNVYTLLGAAVADKEFSAELFADPLEAARKLGIVLTTLELRGLKAFLTKPIKEEFAEIHSKSGCPTPPCPLSIAKPHCDPVSVDNAA